MHPIYLDYNATTPVDPAVAVALFPYLNERFGNPSSSHFFGGEARSAVERARAELAALLACTPGEIVFTSGGTEANNQALIGTAFANRKRGKHIISSRIEHPAVDTTLRWLYGQGFSITRVPVDASGRVDPAAIRAAITPDTILITVMHANNEVGTIQPLAEIGAVAREHEIIFHSDAAQSVGKIPTRVDDLGVDLLSVAGHKFYAPKGIGALYVRSGTRLDSYLHGAGHERGRRAGTENVPYIVALGKAAQLAADSLATEPARIALLRDRFQVLLKEAAEGFDLNGHATERLPNTLNVSFPDVDGADLLASVPEVAASTGSACHDSSREPSPVLTAMGFPASRSNASVRFSLGRWTSEAELEKAADLIGRRVRQQQGTWFNYCI
jgi:cysteine desulfurase